MFCCDCGADNPDRAKYCHQCGSALYTKDSEKLLALPNKPAPKPNLTQEQVELAELFAIDRKLYECHACGKTDNLSGRVFGLAKKTGTKRAWSDTALSAVLSVVTVPLLGAGMLAFPGKKTQFNVLRLQLILCDIHRDIPVGYYLHPWWEPARQLGYTEFFDADRLSKVKSIR